MDLGYCRCSGTPGSEEEIAQVLSPLIDVHEKTSVSYNEEYDRLRKRDKQGEKTPREGKQETGEERVCLCDEQIEAWITKWETCRGSSAFSRHLTRGYSDTRGYIYQNSQWGYGPRSARLCDGSFATTRFILRRTASAYQIGGSDAPAFASLFLPSLEAWARCGYPLFDSLSFLFSRPSLHLIEGN